MKENCTNIYKNARRDAGITQEQAAGQLNNKSGLYCREIKKREKGRVIG